MLKGKIVVLGITGSIAAYKAADLTSRLVKKGISVHVVMTEAACQFITPLTLKTLSRNPIATNLWAEEHDWNPGHIDLADQADLFLVAPASANTIASFANGQAPDLLSSIYLATQAPVLIAPAMNGKMWDHPATTCNVQTLTQRGHHFIEPVEGELACGYIGKGKMAPVEIIEEKALALLGKK